MSSDTETAAEYCSCKVGESSWKCDLPGLPFEIGDYWTQETAVQWSINSITEHLNRQFIIAFCDRSSMDLLDKEAELYRSLLMDDNVSEGTREEARGKLNRHGVNVDALEECFVTETTVYRHMQKCLNIEYEKPPLTTAEAIDRLGTHLDRFRGATATLLSESGQNEDAFRVSVDVNVVCEHCGTIHDGFAYIKQEGCNCYRN